MVERTKLAKLRLRIRGQRTSATPIPDSESEPQPCDVHYCGIGVEHRYEFNQDLDWNQADRNRIVHSSFML